ncbi:MAG: GNAT family N-acetyltransferase, partial [Acidimicrobiia bacterium]|nr:GNAT family N-acetyltransferase [Acidimicrobiia bacterium]
AKPLGVLQYQRSGNDIEIVILISTVRRQGVGRALVEAAQAMGREAGCHRLWLITTNDNQTAQAFWEAMEWSLVAVHWGAVREARKLKPEIPECGEGGTAIEDEVEFEWRCS